MEKVRLLDAPLMPPFDSDGINMFDYENMVKAIRLSWLKEQLMIAVAVFGNFILLMIS